MYLRQIIFKPEGMQISSYLRPFYGLAYYDFSTDSWYAYPIPFNLVVTFWHWLYPYLVFRFSIYLRNRDLKLYERFYKAGHEAQISNTYNFSGAVRYIRGYKRNA